jgi:hypothetical protein
MTCITCVSGFNLQGAQCVSNFNYQISVTFANSTTSTELNNQLSQFVQSIANAANVSPTQVTIVSIIYSSIVVQAIVSTTLEPGSSAAIAQENSLNSAIAIGQPVGGLTVATSSLSTNGGSNSNGGSSSSSGISRTTVIILAVVIPVGTLCNFCNI